MSEREWRFLKLCAIHQRRGDVLAACSILRPPPPHTLLMSGDGRKRETRQTSASLGGRRSVFAQTYLLISGLVGQDVLEVILSSGRCQAIPFLLTILPRFHFLTSRFLSFGLCRAAFFASPLSASISHATMHPPLSLSGLMEMSGGH